MEPGAGAILARQIATPTGNGNGDATALGGKLLAGQRNARVGHIEDSPDVFIVEPLRHDRRGDVDLVLVIAEKDTNLFAKYLAPKVPHRHFCGSNRTCSGECCKQAAHVREHADIDRRLPQLLRTRLERPCRRGAEQRDELAPLHSITSSARASTAGGISRPSAFAVFRLITSSYFVGACTGRSAGFSPLRMRST